jgi:hypothetical protein
VVAVSLSLPAGNYLVQVKFQNENTRVSKFIKE